MTKTTTQIGSDGSVVIGEYMLGQIGVAEDGEIEVALEPDRVVISALKVQTHQEPTPAETAE